MTPASTAERPRVVIVGGGFGGLSAALALKRAAVDVALVDRRNFHLFQPLLYQVATGALSPANIAAPLRALLKRQRRASVVLAEVVDFDVARREVVLAEGRLRYDFLIVAAGAKNHYFGHEAWREHAPGLKTVEDATEIRRRVLLAFERAEHEADAARRSALLTFVAVGAGPTGVELAGALCEIAHDALRHNFRRIDPAAARIVVVEGGDRALPLFPPDLSQRAAESLRALGAELWIGARVVAIDAGGVDVACGAQRRRIDAATVLWAAGVRASELGARLAAATGAALDRGGRVVVAPDLSLEGHPDVFVIGDLAHFRAAGAPLPELAPVAMQQGRHVAREIGRRLSGAPPRPFVYRDRGIMATIGRAAAVADLRGLHLSGFAAWCAWLLVHLLQLVEFQNRVLVLIQWAWAYFTRNRSARLITGAWRPRNGGGDAP